MDTTHMIRLSYQTHEDDIWCYGKTWILWYSLENGEMEFITDWMQLKKKI